MLSLCVYFDLYDYTPTYEHYAPKYVHYIPI